VRRAHEDRSDALVTEDKPYLLAMNCGSSSIKFALYRAGVRPLRQLHGKVDRIGQADAMLSVRDDLHLRQERLVDAPDLTAAATLLIDWLSEEVGLASIAAVGHRVVNGGARYSQPQCVSEDLLDELRRIGRFASEHLPGEIALIELFRQRAAGLMQVVCFDTAFHRSMPRVAKTLPLPRRLQAQGVERRGFHGLSYSFLMQELERVAGVQSSHGRVILAHLGNGASLAAVQGGTGIDTSMGFTPASGVPMGTRSGDLDPGLVLYLAQTEGMTAVQFDHMVNLQSGLLGVSQTSADLRDLLAAEAADARAAEAVAMFCYQVKKCIGAYAAALGGLDTLVFAGGIGENAPEIRWRICAGLGFLGIHLDRARNQDNAPLISSDASPAAVRVIRTDEESMIAEAVNQVLNCTASTPTKA
jgi:acetate kinase